MMVHYLKTLPKHFKNVKIGVKRFELRKNDRGYAVGDTLILLEWENGKYSGEQIKVDVTYMLEDFTGIEKGYCILGIEDKYKKCIYDGVTDCIGMKCEYKTMGCKGIIEYYMKEGRTIDK